MDTMKPITLFCIVSSGLLTIASAFAQTSAAPAIATTTKPVLLTTPAPSKASMSAAECEVWNRERSFAASVEHHDAAAFADHEHAQAAFDAGSPEPIHGRAAVVDGWKGVIEGKQIKLRWSPGFVTIGGDGSLAISRGPSWIEDLRPDPKQPDSVKRYRIGEFISTWIRDADGKWRVMFDGGAAPMHAATADDVAKLIASLPEECPQSTK